jgi:hypothetical protein
MKALALEQSAVMRNIGLHSDIKAMQGDEDRARAAGQAYDEARERMATLVSTPAEREIIESLAKSDGALDKPFAQALGLSTSFQNEAARRPHEGSRPLVQKTLADLNQLIELQKKASDDAVRASMVSGDRVADQATYGVTVVVLVLAILVAVGDHAQHHRVPLRDSLAVAKRVASGDLSSSIVPRWAATRRPDIC